MSSSSSDSGDPRDEQSPPQPVQGRTSKSSQRLYSTLTSLGLRSAREGDSDQSSPLTVLLQRNGSRQSSMPIPDKAESPRERQRYRQRRQLMATVNAHMNSPPSSPSKSSSRQSLDSRRSLDMARSLSSSSFGTANGSANGSRISPRRSRRSITPLLDEEPVEELESRRPYTAGVDAFTSNKRSSVISVASNSSRRPDSYDGGSTSASSSTLHRRSPSLSIDRHEQRERSKSPTDEFIPRMTPRTEAFPSHERSQPSAEERRRIRDSLMQSNWTPPALPQGNYKRSSALNNKSTSGGGTSGSGSSGKSRPGIPAEFRQASQSPYLSPTVRDLDTRSSVSPVPTNSSRGSGGQRGKYPDRRSSTSFSEYSSPYDHSTLSNRPRKRSLLSEESSVVSANQSLDSTDELFSQAANGRYPYRGSTSPPSSNASSRKRAAGKANGRPGTDSWWDEVQELRQRIGALEMSRPESRAESIHSLQDEEREELMSRTPVSKEFNQSLSVRSATSLDFTNSLGPSRVRPRESVHVRRSTTSLGRDTNLASPSTNVFEGNLPKRTPVIHSPEGLGHLRAEHHKLLYDSVAQFDRSLLSGLSGDTPASVEFLNKLHSLVDITSQLNIDIRAALSHVIEAQVEAEIDDEAVNLASNHHLPRAEKNINQLLRQSDEQVRRFTESLLAFTRLDRERTNANRTPITPPKFRAAAVRERMESRLENYRPPTSAGSNREDFPKRTVARAKTVGYSAGRERRHHSLSDTFLEEPSAHRRAKDSATSQGTVRPSALTHFPRSSVANVSTAQATTDMSPTQWGERSRAGSFADDHLDPEEDDMAQFSLSSDLTSDSHTQQKRRFSLSSTSAATALRLGLSSITSTRSSGKLSSQLPETPA